MNIGAKIKEIRESKGVMQKFIEERMGKPSGWLSRIENNKQGVLATELFKISDLLSVHITDFHLPINIANGDIENNKPA